MMTFSVMLVDDEPWAMIDLLHSVDWEQAGFRVAGYYNNPREALQEILSKRPDVVFVDIKMPGMDGFQLIDHCREQGSGAEFIILSSYSDFEYAKQAIRAAVLDYCLKPVNPQNLEKLLGEVCAHLEERQGEGDGEAEGFDEILAYISSNYYQKLSLNLIAEKFSFNRNYICYLFQKNLGATFVQHLSNLRMEEAKKLLVSTGLSLKEIALKCGFGDYYYFNRVFKKMEGVTPTAYRKANGVRVLQESWEQQERAGQSG